MNDIEKQAAHLRKLGTLTASSRRRAEVVAALDSKWEGIQAVALKVLGAWGGQRSARTIKIFLQDAFQREHASSVRRVAIQALGPLLGPADVKWVLDLYFGLSERTNHEIFPLLRQLPAGAARNRLVSELHGKSSKNRQAAASAIHGLARQGTL